MSVAGGMCLSRVVCSLRRGLSPTLAFSLACSFSLSLLRARALSLSLARAPSLSHSLTHTIALTHSPCLIWQSTFLIQTNCTEETKAKSNGSAPKDAVRGLEQLADKNHPQLADKNHPQLANRIHRNHSQLADRNHPPNHTPTQNANLSNPPSHYRYLVVFLSLTQQRSVSFINRPGAPKP